MKANVNGPATFDASSARSEVNGFAGTRHVVYIAKDGARCLLCISSAETDVAVSWDALKLARERAAKGETWYIRLQNTRTGFDETVLMDQLREKPPRRGHYGQYVFYGPP
jgi:hypothetical protein